MTIAVVILAFVEMILGVGLAIMGTRLSKSEKHIRRLAMKVADASEYIGRIDDSTGKSIRELGINIHKLEMEYETFKKLYGEAAVERERESARAEKAWADGINSIMSYGTQLHGRGDAK